MLYYRTLERCLQDKDFDGLVFYLCGDWYASQNEFYLEDNVKPLEDKREKLNRIIQNTKSADKLINARTELKDVQDELMHARERFFEEQNNMENLKNKMLEFLYAYNPKNDSGRTDSTTGKDIE